MANPNKPTLFIGLDAGAHTGVAVWDAEAERFAVLTTTTFWEAVDIVESYPAAEVVVVIEDPAQNKTTFGHGTPRTLKAARRREKISRDVGQNQREARLLADGLVRRGYRVRRRPRSSKTAWLPRSPPSVPGPARQAPSNSNGSRATRAEPHSTHATPAAWYSASSACRWNSTSRRAP